MIVPILQTRELRLKGLKCLAQGHVILQQEPPLPDSQASVAFFPITVFFSTYHPSFKNQKESHFLQAILFPDHSGNSVISPSADLLWQ